MCVCVGGGGYVCVRGVGMRVCGGGGECVCVLPCECARVCACVSHQAVGTLC